MWKKTKKDSSTEVVKPLTKEEIQLRFDKNHFYETHPDNLYAEIWKILPRINSIEDYSEEDKKMVTKWAFLNSFERNHYFVWSALSIEVWITAVEITNNLIKEYDCNTTLEKTLCEVIALNYWKVMQISKSFTGVMKAWEYLSDERTRYLGILTKELDRANRTYLMSLNNLLEIKTPHMKINIKTKNAYFWENQQINNNIPKDENINT
jgi:hypothetical protein